MKAIFCDGQGGIRFREMPAPTLQDGQVGIRAVCSLISPGTELHYVKQARHVPLTQPLGYCSSGYVERVGAGVEGFSVGDRVIAMGWGYAIHAERICVPQRLCVKLPPDLPFEKAVFANLAATALHAVHRAGLSGRERILVIGAGLVGQLVAQCVRIHALEVYVADRLPGRLKVAQVCGARATFNTLETPLTASVERITAGQGVHSVFLCLTGDATSVLADSIHSLARSQDGHYRGTMVCVGRFEAQVDFSVEMGNVDLRYAARCGTGYRDDEYVHGRRNYAPPPGEATVESNLRDCVRLIRSEAIKTVPLHTHRLPFTDALQAYALFQVPDSVLGVTLDY